MKVAVVLGTRPEIIKMSPVIAALEKSELSHYVVHTNQHYSPEMDEVFFDDLKLERPKYNLDVGSGTHGKMTALALERIEEVFIQDRPDVVLVQGDTNTVLAGALAASKMGILVGHVEAGLRSGDRSMPEELNRIMVDHISDFLFVPTEAAKVNCLNEGIDEEKVFVVGNTVVDAVMRNVGLAPKKEANNDDASAILTLHRPSNVDDPKRLQNVLDEIGEVEEVGVGSIRFYAHPRTAAQMQKHGITLPRGMELHKPIGYLEMLSEIQSAKIIFTDSGGIQEEACILKVSSVTIRNNTERPETIEVGANLLAGRKQGDIVSAARKMLAVERDWKNPFGGGDSSEKIIDILEHHFA